MAQVLDIYIFTIKKKAIPEKKSKAANAEYEQLVDEENA
jgi:hypothetical protein